MPPGHKLPKGLEILPDDSSEEAARKRKKLNMFKRQEKKAREERAGDDRRSSWQNFSKKNKTVQKAKNGHDPNWDPTRDHGPQRLRARVHSGRRAPGVCTCRTRLHAACVAASVPLCRTVLSGSAVTTRPPPNAGEMAARVAMDKFANFASHENR